MSATMLELARDVVPHLGEGWRADDGKMSDGRDAYLRHTDGREIHLYRTTVGGRVVASGRVEREHLPYSRYGDAFHEITMSATKLPRQVAGDITRRLLPGYGEVFYLAQTNGRAERLREDQRGRLLRELVEAMGLDIDDMRPAHGHRHMSDGAVESSYPGTTTVDVAVRVSHPTDDGVFDSPVSFQIDVAAPLARKVADLIGQLREQEGCNG